MERRFLFIGLILTSLVILLSIQQVNSLPKEYPSVNKEVKRSTMLISATSASRLPIDNSHDNNKTQFKATPSFRVQASDDFVRLNFQVLFSFSTFYDQKHATKHKIISLDVFNTFLITLFRVIVSPNAP